MAGRPSLLLLLLVFAYTALSLSRRSVQDIYTTVTALHTGSHASDLGKILSAQSLAYTASKLISGLLVDQVNPFSLLIRTLWATGGGLLLMSITADWYAWFLLYGFNGLLLGMTWPAIAKILRLSVDPEELATWWGVVSASINLAGAIGPWLTLSLVNMTVYWLDKDVWKVNFWFVGLACVVFGFILRAYQLYGSELACFYSQTKATSSEYPANGPHPVPRSNGAQVEKKHHSLPQQLMRLYRIMPPANRQLLYCSATAHMGSTFLRFAISNWFSAALHQYDKFYALTMINSFITSFEIGGLLGNLISGPISDLLMRKCHGPYHRIWAILLHLLPASLMLVLLSLSLNRPLPPIMLLIIGLLLGIAVFGAVSLCGVLAVELAPPSLSGTGHALSALCANFGASLACYPITLLADYIGWSNAFIASGLFATCSALPILIFSKRHLKTT